MTKQVTRNRVGHPACASSFACASAPASGNADYTKWKARMQTGIKDFISQHPNTFQRRIRRGIPKEFRWEVWKAAVMFDDLQSIIDTSTSYESLYASENRWSHLIVTDTSRTFPEHAEFTEDHRAALFRILNAYANLNQDVGYCQGMNFVAGLLLIVSKSEYETFWMFVRLMDYGKLNELYMEKFPLLHRYIRAFDLLMEESIPELREHFLAENLDPAVYLHRWFLTLFINCLPLDTVLVIWDVIVCDGPPVMLSISVALLKVLEDVLIQMNFEDIVKFFKTIKLGDYDNECDGTVIGKLLIRQSDTIDIPPHVMQELRDPEEERLTRQGFHVPAENSCSCEACSYKALSKGWPLMAIPEDSRLKTTYYDFL